MDKIGKKEAFLRILSIVSLVLTACLVGFDHQTKTIIYTITKKATFRDLNALFVLVWVEAAAAVYNLMQLVLRCYLMPGFRKELSTSYRYVAWGIYLFDQASVYTMFAANSAAVQASMFAVTGEKSLQWMKLCNRFTRFCTQIAVALLFGYFATLLMVITSSISAYNLFRNYSPKKFLQLKPN